MLERGVTLLVLGILILFAGLQCGGIEMRAHLLWPPLLGLKSTLGIGGIGLTLMGGGPVLIGVQPSNQPDVTPLTDLVYVGAALAVLGFLFILAAVLRFFRTRR